MNDTHDNNPLAATLLSNMLFEQSMLNAKTDNERKLNPVIARFLEEQKPAEKAPKAKRAKAVKATPKPVDYSRVFQSATGSLDAEEFLLMMRNASTVHEKQELIHAYYGYDIEDNLAGQEYRAKMQAWKEYDPAGFEKFIGTANYSRSFTVGGFVAGMPHNQSKAVQNLLARERLATDEIVRLQREANDDPSSAAMCEVKIGIEQERIAQIRADLWNIHGFDLSRRAA